ncbi:MAG: hypothetical protein KQI78_16865 [Deltaproteobacteria bacterium]|nr:hypothetical protein [Deltaproteobacteria bacterium]
MRHLIFACLLGLLLATPAAAGPADVTSVSAAVSGPGQYRFSVTVHHTDEGWDHYADRWEVLHPDGTVLGTRTLYHPHVDEQPFTRDLSGVSIPDDITTVVVRAHDSVHGFSGVTQTVTLPGR